MLCDYILCNWTLKSPSRDVLNKCMYVCTRTWAAYWAYKLMLWPYWGMPIMTFLFEDAKELNQPWIENMALFVHRKFRWALSYLEMIFKDNWMRFVLQTALGIRLLNLAKALSTKTWDASAMIVISLFCPGATRTPPNGSSKNSPVQLLVQQEKTASGDREEIAGIASRLDNLQVNEFLSFLPLLNDFFARQASNFKGGKFLKKLWCCVGGSIAR